MEFFISEKIMDTEDFEQTLSRKQEQLEGICRSIWSVVSFAAVLRLVAQSLRRSFACLRARRITAAVQTIYSVDLFQT